MYLILQVQFDFALEVWFSIFPIIVSAFKTWVSQLGNRIYHSNVC